MTFKIWNLIIESCWTNLSFKHGVAKLENDMERKMASGFKVFKFSVF